MTGNDVLTDSSVLIDLMKGDTNVVVRFQSFQSVFITPIVLAELYFGAYRSANPPRNVAKISFATQQCTILTIDERMAEQFVAIKLTLQAKGKPIPENHIWIAASAIQHQLAVYTKDAHFKNIDGLQLI